MCNKNKPLASLLYTIITISTLNSMDGPIFVQEYGGDSVEISFIGGQQITPTQLSELQKQYNQNKRPKITLRFTNNNVTKLPPKICTLTDLTHLDVSSNNLNELPYTLGILTKLRVFSCHNNILSDLPTTVKNLTNLTSLNIATNKFELFPNLVLALTTLQSLSFARNKIRTLSPEIQNLKNLRHLHARDNILSSLPRQITQLQNLEILDLSNNKLAALPADLVNCKKLRALDLLHNSQLPLRSIKTHYPALIEKLGGKLQANRDEEVSDGFLRIGTPEPLILHSPPHRISPEMNQLAIEWLVDLLKNVKFW